MPKLPDFSSARLRTLTVRSLALLALVLALPAQATAQERDVVFNQFAVSAEETAIQLEFADGSTLSATLRDGQVLIDGEEVGRYTPGGQLEQSFRQLLGNALAAENGELARLLREWTPPADLDEEQREAARALAQEFDRVFSLDATDAPGTLQRSADDERLLRELVLEPEYLRALTAAALDRNLGSEHVALGQEFRIARGDVLDGSLLALGSRVEVDGTLDGDLVLLGGRLRVGPDGRVTGDVHWSGSDLEGNLDGIQGDRREIDPVTGLSDSELRDRIRSEVREATADVRSSARRSSRSPFSGVLGGIGGVFRSAVSFAIFLAVGLAILHFFPRQFEVVSRTAANTPGKSFLVGVAGIVLALPIWITGMLILTVSIIGIPVLLLWIPAVPLALAGLTILGFVAASRNVGRWVSHRDVQGLQGVDTSRPAVQIGVGLVVLLGAFALASILEIGGFIFSPFAILLYIAGYLLAVTAGCVGLGAVLLSQAGRDPGHSGLDWDFDPDPWRPTPGPTTPGGGSRPSATADPDITSDPGPASDPAPASDDSTPSPHSGAATYGPRGTGERRTSDPHPGEGGGPGERAGSGPTASDPSDATPDTPDGAKEEDER